MSFRIDLHALATANDHCDPRAAYSTQSEQPVTTQRGKIWRSTGLVTAFG
jgi:hypothetical protein